MGRKSVARIVFAISALTAIVACQTEVVAPVVVSRVTVEPGTASVSEGQDLVFTARVIDELQRSLDRADVEWSSDDPRVLSVDPNGTARGLRTGSTVVRASFEGVSGVAEVVVLPAGACMQAPKKRPKGKPGGKGKKKGWGGDDDGDDDDDGDGDGDDDDDDDGDDDGDDDDDGDGDEGDDDDDDGQDGNADDDVADDGDDQGTDDDQGDEDEDEDGEDPRCVAPAGASVAGGLD